MHDDLVGAPAPYHPGGGRDLGCKGQEAAEVDGPLADAAVEEPGGDVVQGAHALEEEELLEDEPDVLAAQPREVLVGQLAGIEASDLDDAFGLFDSVAAIFSDRRTGCNI